MKIEKHLDTCVFAALAGGDAIRDLAPKQLEVRTKAESYMGKQHAVVTNADTISQRMILNAIRRMEPDARFITEETVHEPELKKQLIRGSSLDELKTSGCFIIDELDNTSGYSRGSYDWSVSVGYVNPALQHTAGAVYAPKVGGGTLFYASSEKGSWARQMGRAGKKAKVSEVELLKDAYVLVGVDCFRSKNLAHNKALVPLGDAARTLNSSGSCALGLGLVASGTADVLVQPLQSIWDWAAGRALVEMAGGRFLFYEMENGSVIPVKEPRLEHYTPDERKLGFVAGNPRLVEPVLNVLLEKRPE